MEWAVHALSAACRLARSPGCPLTGVEAQEAHKAGNLLGLAVAACRRGGDTTMGWLC